MNSGSTLLIEYSKQFNLWNLTNWTSVSLNIDKVQWLRINVAMMNDNFHTELDNKSKLNLNF